MNMIQSGIFDAVPPLARYLFFSMHQKADLPHTLLALKTVVDGKQTVVGLGQSVELALDSHIEGLRIHPHYAGTGFEVPSTPIALWCWLRGNDRGELYHRTRALQKMVSSSFHLEKAIDAFRYGPGLDLTGYEDGTENPQGEAALKAAFVQGEGAGMEGSSFVAVQQWVHDLNLFESMNQEEQDHTIGRRKSDNEELEEAPESAHVKRTAQESFDPEAFILRRSMPWVERERSGLVFVAFGKSFDAFEALLQRMVGVEDGTADALFQFTRPVTGSYFWCPPLTEGHLDLRALRL